jgi:hypothetical protein
MVQGYRYILVSSNNKKFVGLGMVAYACNPRYSGGRIERVVVKVSKKLVRPYLNK